MLGYLDKMVDKKGKKKWMTWAFLLGSGSVLLFMLGRSVGASSIKKPEECASCESQGYILPADCPNCDDCSGIAQDLANCQGALNSCTSNLGSCQNEVNQLDSDLFNCENNYEDCQNDLSNCQSDLINCNLNNDCSDCESDLTDCQSDLIDANNNYSDCQDDLIDCQNSENGTGFLWMYSSDPVTGIDLDYIYNDVQIGALHGLLGDIFELPIGNYIYQTSSNVNGYFNIKKDETTLVQCYEGILSPSGFSCMSNINDVEVDFYNTNQVFVTSYTFHSFNSNTIMGQTYYGSFVSNNIINAPEVGFFKVPMAGINNFQQYNLNINSHKIWKINIEV